MNKKRNREDKNNSNSKEIYFNYSFPNSEGKNRKNENEDQSVLYSRNSVFDSNSFKESNTCSNLIKINSCSKSNYNFFKNEYEKAVNCLKTIDPENFLKTRKEKMQSLINKTKIYSKEELESNRKNKDDEINAIRKYLSTIKSKTNYFGTFENLKFLMIPFASLFIYSSIDWISDINKPHYDILNKCITHILNHPLQSFILIIFIILLIFLSNILKKTKTNTIKLTADKIIHEIENHIRITNPEKIIDIEIFSIAYCEENNVSRQEFNKTILKEMKKMIKYSDTNLVEDQINLDGEIKKFLKLKY